MDKTTENLCKKQIKRYEGLIDQNERAIDDAKSRDAPKGTIKQLQGRNKILKKHLESWEKRAGIEKEKAPKKGAKDKKE